MRLFRKPDRWHEVAAYYEACRHTVHDKYQRVIKSSAGRVGMPNVSEADWIAVANFYLLTQLIEQFDAPDLRSAWDEMNGLGKAYVFGITAAHTYGDKAFAKVLKSCDPEDAPKFEAMRRSWKTALSVHDPRAQPDESLGRVLARFHRHIDCEAAYTKGLAALRTGTITPDDLSFLMPFAIERLRCLSARTACDYAAAPDYGALSVVEKAAANHMWATITAGLDITDLMSSLSEGTGVEEEEDHLSLALAERFYVFQQRAAEVVNYRLRLPDSLPSGEWLGYTGSTVHKLDVFDIGTELIRCSIDYHAVRSPH